MGFYGNITNINKSSFSFDKIYANRKEMDANAAIDGVYVGRYVLVDYDKKSILATQASEVADSFNISNDPLRYADIVEGFEKYYNYNLDLLEQKTNSNLRPAWMIIQTDGSYEFHTGPSYATPVYEFSEDSGEGLHAGDLVLLLGKRRCITEIPDDLKFSDAYELENYQSNELASITMQDGTVYSYFIPEIWYCTGGRPVEWTSNGIDYIKTVATFEKSSITYSEQVDMNNATLFNSNYSEDAVAYGKIGRGWDSTVWQKTTGVNSKGQVINKYVMIAELNSVVPTLDISVDAPTQTPIAPHFGTDISNVYYKMHLQPTWGMRVKSSYSDYTTDQKRYPSDISGAFLIDTLLNDGTVARIGRRVKTLPDGTTQIVDYPPVLDEYGNVVPEDIEDMPLAIYFNKEGFDPYQGSDAITTVEHDYGTDALNSIARNVGTRTRPNWEIRDTIAIKPTGTSNQEYNVHTAEGDLLKKNLPDTYEMSIMLPSIGNMANTFWDMLYGPNAKEDIKGRSLWHVTTGAFVKNDDPSTYVRNTEFRWNTRNGRRGITNALFDSSFYIGTARNPIAKSYDEIMELKETNPSTSLLVKNSFNDNYINIGTVGDFNPVTTHLLQDRLLYNVEDLNTVAGSINTLHDLTGMIVRYTSLNDANASVKIPDDYIADFTNSAQRNLLWEDRAEGLADWDPTKIYYDISDQKYYYKNKTYVYSSSTTGYERSGSHWYKPISGSKFIDLNTAKYYRAERMEYPRYSETNLTKDVMNLPYFDYILAKSENDYVEGAVYYQVYDEDYFLSNPNVQTEKTRLENAVAEASDPVVIEEAQEQLTQFLKGEYKNSNDEIVLRFPTPLILYNVGYEPGIYSYEDTNSAGQKIYTLDNAALPTRPDARYIKITGSRQQQGFVLYTSGGFYRWDNRDETLILCRNASLKGALDLPEDFVPEHPETELITSSYEWNEKVNLYDEDKNVIGEDNRFVFFPRNQAFEEYLHIADSEEGKTIYVAGDEIPDVIPINFPANQTRWQIELEEDNKIYLYIYVGMNDEDHNADKLLEEGHDKIPVENILFKRESYLQELNSRLEAYVENPGTLTKANLDTYIELLNNNNENKYFDQYQAYLYLCITTPEQKDENDNVITQEVSDYLPFWTIITEGYTFKLENGKKVPKMVISTIGKESSSSSIHFDAQEAKEKGLNVHLKEFEPNTYYYHPNNDTNKWASEIRANLLTESGLWRNTLNGGYNGYYTIEYETLPPESQLDDFEEVNDNNHFRFFTLDRNQAYRYQDLEGNWREEILSRTYPRDTRDINYYDIKFLRVPSDKIVYQSGTYYEKINGEFVLTEDTAPDATKTYYQIEQRYVESDSSGIYKTGSIWNEEVVPIPDTVSVGFREESWQPKAIKHYANTENTFNGLILRQNNMMREGDALTRDRSTVQGTINTLNDIIAKFYTLTPCEFVTVDEYGRVHSASWDSMQPDNVKNLGLLSDVRPAASADKHWINLTLDDDKDTPHFTIKHMYNPVNPVSTYANKNENSTVSGNVGLNHSSDDTLKLFTPIIDATGHVVGENTETVVLPFNYKVVTIGTQSEVIYDSTRNSLTAGSTIDKNYSGTGSLVAENTKDTFTVNTGNKWIRLVPDTTNKSFQISHEVHNINVSNNSSTDLNSGNGADTIIIPDWDFDNAGHITEKHSHEYTLPYGYKFIQDESNNDIVAGNTQDHLVVIGDNYLTTSVNNHTLTISHDKVNPTTVAEGTLVSNVTQTTFGGTFTIADYSFDGQGHRIQTGSHIVTFPQGQLSNGTHNAASANVITSLAFDAPSGTITKTDANVGTLPLTGYAVAQSISAMPAEADSINTAISKIAYILNNKTDTVDSRITTAINALDVTETSNDFIAKIKQENGIIVATTGTFGTSGTIATDSGSNREVVTSVSINSSGTISGTKLTLGTAAMSATTDFDSAGSANTVKTELIGSATDTQTSDTITGAKKYTDSAITTVEGKQYGASGSTQYTFAEMAAKLNDLEARLAALES